MLTQEVCEAVLRDHFKNPRHFGIADCQSVYHAENPACGDIIDLGLKTEGGEVEWKFEGKGCAASQAGMSLVLKELQSLQRGDSEKLAWIHRFKKELREGTETPESGYDSYHEAAALFVFRSIPARLECVCLGLNLLERELQKSGN